MKKMPQVKIRKKLLFSAFAAISMWTLPVAGQNMANKIDTHIDGQPDGVQQVQWLSGLVGRGGNCDAGTCGDCDSCNNGGFGGFGGNGDFGQGGKSLFGVNQFSGSGLKRESGWANAGSVPWEAFGFGEYIGPHRAPHVGEYRLRVDDELEFVYLLTREKSMEPYQLYVGDVIQISSAIDSSLSQEDLTVLSDGTISLSLIGRIRVAGKTVSDLQRELNDRYTKYVKNPAIVVQVTESDTPLRDLIQSVDATAGQGGQVRQATVSPDGTVQLPLVGSVPAIGLTGRNWEGSKRSLSFEYSRC